MKFSNFLEKQGTISEYHTLQKAFVKAESIQAISKKSKNQKLIDAVQNKIELLKMIIWIFLTLSFSFFLRISFEILRLKKA